MTQTFDLDKTLIEFPSGGAKSYWTIREAVEGVQIFGGIGSGKTSGSGRMIALKYLSNGFGGLVLTAKAEEKAMWQEYCRLAGRKDDLIIIEPGGEQSFNFLEYESTKGNGKSFTDNIVQVLKTVIRAGDDKGGVGGDDRFWETAMDMLIFNVIDLCQLAYGHVSIQDVYDITISTPKKENKTEGEQDETKKKHGKDAFTKAFERAQEKVDLQVEKWLATLSPERLQELSDLDLFEKAVCDALPDARLYRFIDQFFIEKYRTLNDKTRSIIDFIFIGFLFRLLKEPVYSLFCHNASTVVPEDSIKGKIILLNFPVKQYNKVGKDIQIMFKYIWQRAMEKRDVTEDGRPVFLWADEAQNFLHEHDAEYQATARSSRIATVYISQNLPNYNANMGGNKWEQHVQSFLGTLATKIFHANADIETNNYASNLIGEAYFENVANGVTIAKEFSHNSNTSIVLEKQVRPEEFARFRTGGPVNEYRVEGIMHVQGNVIGDGKSHIKMKFNQLYKP